VCHLCGLVECQACPLASPPGTVASRRAHLTAHTILAAGTAATTANGCAVADAASIRSVGLLLVAKEDLRAGEEGSGSDLASSHIRRSMRCCRSLSTVEDGSGPDHASSHICQIYAVPPFAGTVEEGSACPRATALPAPSLSPRGNNKESGPGWV
jgi:hypothetical protein